MKKKDIPSLLSKKSAHSNSETAINSKYTVSHQPNEPAGFHTIQIPGSKSISNRAILLASLARGRSHLQGVLYSDDTTLMIKICRQLGASIAELEDGSLVIEGLGGRLQECSEELYVGNAGTCARFLCAALVRGGTGSYILRGSSRMHERPISELVKALGQLGAKIEYLEKEGFLPLKIHSKAELRGGAVHLDASRSSQFISALMMLAPYTVKGMDICIEGDFVSASYIAMTQTMMTEFGVDIQTLSARQYYVPGLQEYLGREYNIPADASSASYFFALAAMTGLTVRIEGLRELPLQSDLGFVNILNAMGAEVRFEDNAVTVQGHPRSLKGISVDMSDMSDVVPTLAVVAILSKGKTEITKVAHMRGKECDRIRALCNELRKLGAKVTEHPDGLHIEPPVLRVCKDVLIRTYDDHRIAMAFAVLAKCIPGIEVENPECVQKTFPGFFEVLNFPLS
jgi:3-phosphoshikimate 1-carboxyvinyltransferase